MGLSEAGDTPDDPIPVAIETSRGLLVAALRGTGREVYAINPMAVARYRERRSMARKKSDHFDAMTLANILRTDSHAHRKLPDDSDLARSITVLTRAAQDAIWQRTKATQELRALLREYYPGLLEAFAGSGHNNLATPDARAILAIAPTPQGARLTKARIVTALRRAGRQRRLDGTATRIQDALRRPKLRQPPLVEKALGRQARALLGTLNTECANADDLNEAASEDFRQLPDHHVITSFPGLGEATGARVLAEMGHDRDRFADARRLKAFAGSAPVTRASGRGTCVTHWHVKNNRLAAVGFVWAFAAIPRPGPVKDQYDRRRTHGDRHAAALRNVFIRLLGQLYYVKERISDFESPVPEIVGATEPEHVFRWVVKYRDPLKTWAKGPATLLGDACHPTSSYAGYGAGMAIEDGFFLGRYLEDVDLSDPAQLAAGLRRYADQRVKYTNKVQLRPHTRPGVPWCTKAGPQVPGLHARPHQHPGQADQQGLHQGRADPAQIDSRHRQTEAVVTVRGSLRNSGRAKAFGLYTAVIACCDTVVGLTDNQSSVIVITMSFLIVVFGVHLIWSCPRGDKNYPQFRRGTATASATSPGCVPSCPASTTWASPPRINHWYPSLQRRRAQLLLETHIVKETIV